MRLATPSSNDRAERPSLIHDQGGATMVMGVFIATLLVGMIYYVWGIGDTIMFRERMQDASDTAAFGAAVMHARGMNMISLLNILMNALVIVAATMDVITTMIGSAAATAGAICAAAAFGCAPCASACPYVPIHTAEWNNARNINNRVTNAVRTIVSGMRGYAIGIRNGVPLAAQAKVVSYGTDIYAPVTDFGMMAPPTRLQLPVQDDETNWPCDTKALPWVRLWSPTFVWLFGGRSPYMLGGITYGELRAKSITREWCDDGYFQRVTDNAHVMGNDRYQVQAFMIGSPDQDWTAEGVAVATWGEGEDEGSEYAQLAQTGRLAFAQAEFFYDDPEEDWREWLWHMQWRARLRRFRLSATGVGDLAAACEACGPLGRLGSGIDSLVVH